MHATANTRIPGIVTLQPTSDPETKAAGLARHQIAIIVLGFPTIILGTSFMIYNKISHGAPHFTTWHSVRSFKCFYCHQYWLTEAADIWAGGCRVDSSSDVSRRRQLVGWSEREGFVQISQVSILYDIFSKC